MGTTIANIFRYPVKSMGGHQLDEALLSINGIPGDRSWALKDEELASIKGGKRHPSLMGMSAEFEQEPDESNVSPHAQIRLPDGSIICTRDDDAEEKLSQALGTKVTLWPILPKEQLDHYRRSAPDPNVDAQLNLREIFARTPDEPLPDLRGFPKELFEYESPPGTYFDAFPLLLISKASLQSLEDHSDQSKFDVRRFRPNVLLETDEAGYPEEEWAGKSGRIGTAKLKFEMACPRCIMTTHGFDDLPKDPRVMRTLVQANNGNLGIYASVVEAGTIAVGDSLILE